jgi:hypothetical protein
VASTRITSPTTVRKSSVGSSSSSVVQTASPSGETALTFVRPPATSAKIAMPSAAATAFAPEALSCCD